LKIREISKGNWNVDVTIKGRRIREHGFTSKKRADEFVAELKVQAKRGKFGLELERPRVTVGELVRQHGSEIDQSRPRGRQLKKIVESFLASLPPGLYLDELRSAHLREWVKRLKVKGLGRRSCGPPGCNRYLAEVSVMLRAAPSMFSELDEDWRPPRIPWQKESRRGRERVISAEETRALLQELRFSSGRADGGKLAAKDVVSRRDVADCFEIALLTGMRGGEVRSLEWSEIELDQAEIHLPAHKTKTREPRVVLLNDRAVKIFGRRQKLRGQKGSLSGAPKHFNSRYVFPNERGDGPRKEISRVIRPVALQLGLRYGTNLPDGFTPHSTRHTATTEMLRRGHDLKTVQDVVGHSDKVMSLRYAHSTRESRRAAVADLVLPRQKVDKGKRA